MSDTEDNLKCFDKLDMQSQIVCPYCGEGDFDRIGLKYHLEHSCDKYTETKSIRVFWSKND